MEDRLETVEFLIGIISVVLLVVGITLWKVDKRIQEVEDCQRRNHLE